MKTTTTTVLVSGFSAFGPYPANSSGLVAESLECRELRGYSLRSHIFSATIPKRNEDRGYFLFQRALQINARGIISLGMSSTKRGFAIETLAANRICDDRYCPKQLKDPRVNRKAAYDSKIPIDLSGWNIGLFRYQCGLEGLDVETSANAGGFCCNHLIYQLLVAQKKTRRFRLIHWIFIHIPCSPEAVPNPMGDFETSGKITMNVEEVIHGLGLLLDTANI
jgi:pyrrolidone-carboxylate peptidase